MARDVGLQHLEKPRVIYLGNSIYAARSVSKQPKTLHSFPEKPDGNARTKKKKYGKFSRNQRARCPQTKAIGD